MKLFLFTAFLTVAAQLVTAQNTTTALSLSGGYIDNGFGIDATYNHYLTQDAKLHVGVFFSSFTQDFRAEEIPNSIVTLNASYNQVVWANYSKAVRISLGLGAVAGYEWINNGEDRLPSGAIVNGENTFIYGLSGGGEADITLTDQFSLLLQFIEYYHINSDTGNFMPYASIGLRYFLF